MAALLPLLWTGGCATITLDGASEAPPTVSTKFTSSSRIDMLTPRVRRTGASTAEISFDLDGSFEMTETRTTPGFIPGGGRLAVGFFPGSALHSSAANPLKSFWYNICFLGTPTLYGLFAAPFVEIPKGGGSVFSKSALLGFYRWREPDRHVPAQKASRNWTRERLLLKNVVCRVDGRPVEMREGVISLSGLPSGAQTVNVSFTIPASHPLGGQLRRFEQGEIPVTVPEEVMQ